MNRLVILSIGIVVICIISLDVCGYTVHQVFHDDAPFGDRRGSFVYPTLTIYDLNDDGYSDILYGTIFECAGDNYYKKHMAAGRGSAYSTIGDVDNDGEVEIVSIWRAGSHIAPGEILPEGTDRPPKFLPGYTQIIVNKKMSEFNYSEVWRSEKMVENGGYRISAIDLDNDGEAEILVGVPYNKAFENLVIFKHIKDNNYSIIFNQSINDIQVLLGLKSRVTLVNEINIYDTSNDGKKNIIIASTSGILILKNNGNFNFVPLWAIGGEFYGVEVADVDNDGKDEIITNGLVINPDENFTYASLNLIDIIDPQQVAVGDLNKNGIKEIVIGTKYGDIYAFEYNGTDYQRVKGLYDYKHGLIAHVDSPLYDLKTADTDKDGILELIVGSKKDLYIFEVSPEPSKVKQKPPETLNKPSKPPEPDNNLLIAIAIILITTILSIAVIWKKKR